MCGLIMYAIVCELETRALDRHREIVANYLAPRAEALWRLRCGPLLDVLSVVELPETPVIAPAGVAPPVKAVLLRAPRRLLRAYSRPQTEPISRDAHIFFLSLLPTHTRLSWQPEIKGARRALLKWPKGSRRLPPVQATKALSFRPSFKLFSCKGSLR